MSEKHHITLDQLAKSLRNAAYKSSATKSDETEGFRSINFLSYMPPPYAYFAVDQKSGKLTQQYNDVLNKYCERLEYLHNDLEYLLNLPIKSFLNQILNDKTFNDFFVSFLKYSPRPYEFIEMELNQFLPEDIRLLLDSIKKRVFMVLYRLSNENEEIKTIENFDIDLIYSSSLFDLSNLFDLTALYEENTYIGNFINTVFWKRGKDYQMQFKNSIPNILKVFKSNQTNLQNIFKLNSSILRQDYVYEDKNHDQLLQLINYFIDLSITLSSFTKINPILSRILLDFDFQNELIDFIEHTVYEIEDVLTRVSRKQKNDKIQLITLKIQILKFEVVKFIDRLFDECINGPIINKNYDSAHLDLFYKSYLNLMEYKKFLIYFTQNFDPLSKLNRVYKNSKDKIDQVQYDYILSNLRSIIHDGKQTENATASENKPTEYETSLNKISELEIKTDKTTEDVESLLEIFPEYTETFLRECLQYFDFKKEQLINAILENNLPETLQSKLRSKSSTATNVVSEDKTTKNRTVFDGDEFDFSNKEKVDYSRIHIGKKSTTDKLLLNEPVSSIKIDIQKQLSTNDNEYEDEYDDTYDDNIDVYQEATFDIKPLNEKLDLKKRDVFENEDEEDENAEAANTNQASGATNEALPPRRKNLNFVEDPAKIRERQQARYEARQAQYAARQPYRQPQRNDENEQDDEKTQRDRRYKNTNKAKLVHHDRRNLAMKKQNRGLLD